MLVERKYEYDCVQFSLFKRLACAEDVLFILRYGFARNKLSLNVYNYYASLTG
jgi:hypothetical protein